MTTHAAVGVDDDLAAGKAGIAHGAAHNKAAGGVDIDLGVVPLDALGVQDRGDDVLDHIGLDDVHVLDGLAVLGRDNHGRDLHGLVVLVAHGDLGLAVGAQVVKGVVLAHGGQALGHAAGQVMGHGHKHGRLVAGIAKHHALVAGAHRVDGIARAAGLGVKGLVDAGGDVGALLVDQVKNAAGIAVKTVLGAVVANAADGLARDLLHVDVGLGAHLAGHDDGTGGGKGLDGAAHVVDVCGNAIGSHVALLGQLGLLGENRVQDGIAHLVADLVGVTLGYTLGGK